MEEQKSNRYVLGILGAIIGAFIGAIPWVLVYAFGNRIVAILSALIAIVSYHGYKITKAKIDKKLPVIITISSILAVTVSVFVIEPLIFLATENYEVSLYNLGIIYGIDEFKTSFAYNYIMSLVFTALGIGGMVANLNKQIKEGVSREDLQINLSNQPELPTQEETQAIKDIFVKNDALSKNNVIVKEEIIADLSTQIPEEKANQVFNILRNQGIIRKSGGGFYFSEKAQNRNVPKAGKTIAITMGVVFVIFAVLIMVVSFTDNSSNKKSSGNNVVESKNSSSLSNTTSTNDEEEYETEHVIEFAGMKFTPLDDLLILTEQEIKTYYGSSYTIYEIIAMNVDGTRVIYCFIDDDETMKEYTAKEYLENSFNEDEYDEIKTIKIAGFEFQTTRLSFEDNSEKYAEDCYVCKIDDKFICFDYCYPEGESSSFEKMISKK